MQTRATFGEGASAAVHGDKLVVPFDHEGQSFIVALNKKTGKTIWKVDRDERTTWSTPTIVEHDGQTHVITNGTNRVRSYDLESGELIWECGGQAGNPIPTPLVMDGVTFCMTGYRGNAIFAIPLDAKGDISNSDEIVWSRNDAAPYTPTGVLYKGTIYYTKSNNGVFHAADAKTGKEIIGSTRLDNISSIYASLVAADDRIYVVGRDGTTNVIKHGEDFEILATNELGESVDATPALVDNQIIMRGDKHLFLFENEE